MVVLGKTERQDISLRPIYFYLNDINGTAPGYVIQDDCWWVHAISFRRNTELRHIFVGMGTTAVPKLIGGITLLNWTYVTTLKYPVNFLRVAHLTAVFFSISVYPQEVILIRANLQQLTHLRRIPRLKIFNFSSRLIYLSVTLLCLANDGREPLFRFMHVYQTMSRLWIWLNYTRNPKSALTWTRTHYDRSCLFLSPSP